MWALNSFFERFVLSFSLKIERFVSDSAEIWICGLYVLEIAPDDPRWALPFYTFEAEMMGWEQNAGWE